MKILAGKLDFLSGALLSSFSASAERKKPVGSHFFGWLFFDTLYILCHSFWMRACVCESVHMGVCVWVLAYVFGCVRVCVLERVWDVE